MKWGNVECETQFDVHGQWWSILGTHLCKVSINTSYPPSGFCYSRDQPSTRPAMMSPRRLKGFAFATPPLSTRVIVGFGILAL